MIEHCLTALRRAGIRVTKNRTLLLEMLHTAKSPVTPSALVAEFHQVGQRVNKTTIYRDLELLERLPLVRRVMMSDRKQYFELVERGHHHHFICTVCDRVEEVAVSDESLLRRMERLSQQHRFRITHHSLEFYGQCATCL